MAGSGTRRRLPDRRPSLTVEMDRDGLPWRLSFGFDGGGRVCEVFLDGAKIGSDLEALADDAGVMASLLLQSGMSAKALARHLGNEGGRGAASVLGAALQSAAAIEEEFGR